MARPAAAASDGVAALLVDAAGCGDVEGVQELLLRAGEAGADACAAATLAALAAGEVGAALALAAVGAPLPPAAGDALLPPAGATRAQLFTFGAAEFQLGWDATGDGRGGGGGRRPRAVLADACAAGGGVVAVASGRRHGVLVTAEGRAFAWGLRTRGRLGGEAAGGTGTAAAAIEPLRVALPSLRSRVVAIAAGEAHVLAATADGALVSWGANEGGQCGHGVGACESVPPRRVGAAALRRAVVVAVAAGAAHSLAVCAHGGVYVAGCVAAARGAGEGAGDPLRALSFQRLSDFGADSECGAAVRVAAGELHSLVLTGTGSVWHAGGGEGGFSLVPLLHAVADEGAGAGAENAGDTRAAGAWVVQPGARATAVHVAAGARHSLAVDTAGRVWTWRAGGGRAELGAACDAVLGARRASRGACGGLVCTRGGGGAQGMHFAIPGAPAAAAPPVSSRGCAACSSCAPPRGARTARLCPAAATSTRGAVTAMTTTPWATACSCLGASACLCVRALVMLGARSVAQPVPGRVPARVCGVAQAVDVVCGDDHTAVLVALHRVELPAPAGPAAELLPAGGEGGVDEDAAVPPVVAAPLPSLTHICEAALMGVLHAGNVGRVLAVGSALDAAPLLEAAGAWLAANARAVLAAARGRDGELLRAAAPCLRHRTCARVVELRGGCVHVTPAACAQVCAGARDRRSHSGALRSGRHVVSGAAHGGLRSRCDPCRGAEGRGAAAGGAGVAAARGNAGSRSRGCTRRVLAAVQGSQEARGLCHYRPAAR